MTPMDGASGDDSRARVEVASVTAIVGASAAAFASWLMTLAASVQRRSECRLRPWPPE